jgi:hypothetical protein
VVLERACKPHANLAVVAGDRACVDEHETAQVIEFAGIPEASLMKLA